MSTKPNSESAKHGVGIDKIDAEGSAYIRYRNCSLNIRIKLLQCYDNTTFGFSIRDQPWVRVVLVRELPLSSLRILGLGLRPSHNVPVGLNNIALRC